MFKIFLCFFTVLFFFSCKTTTYYISRHAERAGSMSSDPQLSPEGEKQALDLRDYLTGKNIKGIFSTNFIRTKSTAQPTATLYSLPVTIYNPAQATTIIDSLKTTNRSNMLIVGHSNTVDDIVNRFVGSGTMSDLAETEYGNLFIVKKKGGGYTFERIKVPQTTPR